ncbi:MAG: PD-(D/E)XK nuclease family protein [Vicinamibacterales bacterium]
MRTLPPFPIIEATSAAVRVEEALSFLDACAADTPVTIVGATREAADDLARSVAGRRPATLGLFRYSLTQLAARFGAPSLAGRGIAPATVLGSEALAARAAFDGTSGGALSYLAGVAATPGFPRALARTVADLRGAVVAPSRLDGTGAAGSDLAWLLARTSQERSASATADRAALFDAATSAVGAAPDRPSTLILLDVAVDAPAEARFIEALVRGAGTVLATIPAHDAGTRAVLEGVGGVVDTRVEAGHTSLKRLRRHVFGDQPQDAVPLDASVQFFSAPGQGRECVEIARRLLQEAGRGVPFDEMAVVVRAPEDYHGLLEHALARADIPAWFERGARRPHPAGRAFLALLACAAEGLSARRFAEYLSLGQLPDPEAGTAAWVPPEDEALPVLRASGERDAHAGPSADDTLVAGRSPVHTAAADAFDADAFGADGASADTVPADAAPVDTLPAPRRWERLLVEASVVGGDPARWARRLAGLHAQFTARHAEEARQDPESPRAQGLLRDRAHLERLRAFASPLIGELATWSGETSWGTWLERLESLAPRVLSQPAHVLRVLADLRPMASVGPVGLDEVRSVLGPRLALTDAPPPAGRFGRVAVLSPDRARGRSFRVVFVPGLAERMFPRRVTQDPLLPDASRIALDPHLPTRAEGTRAERLRLRLAVGAAAERLYLSYPRLDVSEARARVPSFYALDLLRGATGRIPDHETLAQAAAAAGDASLGWPAPSRPDQAIDEQEHDLAVLRELLDADDAGWARGRAQYLLRLNGALRRSVTERWARGERRWSQFDGLIRVTARTGPALARQRLPARSYSLTALQRYAACPYQFLLAAVYRLHPADDPVPIQRLDPLTRGSLVHRVQTEFLRQMRATGALPVTTASLPQAAIVLEAVTARVTAELRDDVVPAIPRVWADEIAGIGRDLQGWLRRVAETDTAWVPTYFELAFGLPGDPGRDERSVPDPIVVDGRFALRGSVDLVEVRASDARLRVTDHKTGRDRTTDALRIGGGRVLQPVVYSLVVEQMLGAEVSEARLFFCTEAGRFTSRPVVLSPDARRAGLEALEVVDRAVETGVLPAAPADGACQWCDFRPVCGPHEETRIRRKSPELLRDLDELRRRP